jgi:Rrf2 family protein
MRLSKASAYAVFAVVHVAAHQKDGPVQGRSIAEAYGIPVEYLLKILQQLVRADILISETGRRGGFLLKRTPERITLLDILEAIEGRVDGDLSVRKDIIGSDALKDTLETLCRDVAERTRSLLSGTTIQMLLTLDRQPTAAATPA